MDLDEVVYQVACGLDVHFTFVTACLVTTGPKGKPKVEERRFPTNQKGLNSLHEWLTENGCEAVGMEATGVYWMPVYAALEGACTLVVGNPQHMKNARGHKTDRLDARWIAGQVRHGRIRSSFVPPPEFREARRLARCRRQLVESRTSIRNEIQRLLAEVGITLAGVVSDVFGTSGTSILNALSEGKCVRDELSIHLYSSLRKKDKMASIAAALEAPLPEVSRLLLAIHLRRIEALDGNIDEVEVLLFKQLAPHAAKLDLLQRIPGISKLSAHIILAEIGVDMTVWPTAKKFSAWAGVAPGCNQTGGRSKRAAVRKGNPYLCTILMECAGGAVQKLDSHLRMKHRRLCAQLGSKKKARMAIAHKLALIIYKVLGENVEYKDPEPKQPSEKAKRRILQTRVKDLERLGYRVVLEPIEAVS
jgi:transposase